MLPYIFTKVQKAVLGISEKLVVHKNIYIRSWQCTTPQYNLLFGRNGNSFKRRSIHKYWSSSILRKYSNLLTRVTYSNITRNRNALFIPPGEFNKTKSLLLRRDSVWRERLVLLLMGRPNSSKPSVKNLQITFDFGTQSCSQVSRIVCLLMRNSRAVKIPTYRSSGVLWWYIRWLSLISSGTVEELLCDSLSRSHRRVSFSSVSSKV